MTQAEQGALYTVTGTYLIAHAVLFRRALGPEDPVAAAGALLLLGVGPGLYLFAVGIQWLRRRAAPRLIRGGGKALVAFGVVTTAVFVALTPSLDYVLRLTRLRTATPLLALWFAPPVLTLLMGILGLAAGRPTTERRPAVPEGRAVPWGR